MKRGFASTNAPDTLPRLTIHEANRRKAEVSFARHSLAHWLTPDEKFTHSRRACGADAWAVRPTLFWSQLDSLGARSDPLTRQPLSLEQLRPNRALKQLLGPLLADHTQGVARK